MDQFVVDLGPTDGAAGDEVVLFGRGDPASRPPQDWADATGTISYEIVTRIGPRVPRRLRRRTAVSASSRRSDR